MENLNEKLVLYSLFFPILQAFCHIIELCKVRKFFSHNYFSVSGVPSCLRAPLHTIAQILLRPNVSMLRKTATSILLRWNSFSTLYCEPNFIEIFSTNKSIFKQYPVTILGMPLIIHYWFLTARCVDINFSNFVQIGNSHCWVSFQ